jgi:hypothetical protein
VGTPANALQAGIYTRLTNYAPLTALTGVNKVYDFAPASAQPPYVLIGDDTAIDWSTKGTSGWETTLTIHCWDFEKAGRKSVKAIMSTIYDALHRQEASITVSGFALVEIASEFEQSFQDTSEIGPSDHFYHGVQRFRALIETP